MRRLIISNFRVGSWYLHDEIVNGEPSHEGLGEISCDFYEDRTTKVNNWLTKTNDIVGKFHPIQWEGGDHRQVIEFACACCMSGAAVPAAVPQYSKLLSLIHI